MYYFSCKNLEPFGDIFVVSIYDYLVGVSCDKKFLEHFKPCNQKFTPVQNIFLNQLDEYLNAGRKRFDVKTKFVFGSNFQKKVWNQLKKIEYSKTVSYKQIAEKIGTKAYRAVGSACAKNPLPIIYPCHRVINKNGKFGKYSLGNDLKPLLLELESEV